MSDTPTQSVPFRAATPSSNETPTRSAQNKNTNTANSQYRVGTTSDDPTPYVYEALNKKPYAVKFLDLDLYHDDKDFPEVREMAKKLDQYVIKQAKAQGLKDDHGSYKEVVDALYKQIGRSSNEDPVKALKRLATAAGAIERLNSAKLQPILSAKTLEPEEFEGIQE